MVPRRRVRSADSDASSVLVEAYDFGVPSPDGSCNEESCREGDSESVYEVSNKSSDDDDTDDSAREESCSSGNDSASYSDGGEEGLRRDTPRLSGTTHETLGGVAGDPDSSVQYYMELPVRFETLREARGVLDGLENSQFALINNNSATKRLWCTSHLDCTAEARIKLDPDGKFRLSRSGIHTTTPAPLASQRTGIHKPLLPEIDNLLLGGQGPQTCLNELKARYAGSDSVLALLPSVGQLKNWAHRLRRSGDFDITSYADIMVWATPRLCSSPATFFGKMRYKPQSDAQRIVRQSFNYQNELLVLGCFTGRLDSGKSSIGIIFSSRILFRTASRTMAGQNEEALGATDGTYKLHFGGWTLVSFGTYGLRFTSMLKYQHKFYPKALMFVKTETASAYARLFSVCKTRCQDFFGVQLDLTFGSLDHSDAIANEFRENWPDIKLLDCWPHLDRNARKKKGILTDAKNYKDIIKPQLDYLSVSRSKEQFEALSELITQNWSDLGEDEYATWLDNEYLTDTWNLWFCTASDAPGIVPNQNPIESHHNTIKTTAVKQLLCFYRSCSSIYATKNYSAMC
ncbi:hypothetical protein DVH05_005565 [Phytophthora capsici]|nr:hypothetical protein DVH05_005565 [Phytophthora capsici]